MKESIYTPPEIAIEELKRRSLDTKLKNEIEKYLKGDIPSPFRGGQPIGVLFRNLCTPDYELDIFLKHAKSLDLEPVLFEYTHDKFVSKNEDKYALGKLFFYLNTTDSGRVSIYASKVIDFLEADGKMIDTINSIWGEPLVEFHHRILLKFFPDLEKSIFEGSEWLHRNGNTAKYYYENFFTLFLQNAILFENFRENSNIEKEFTDQIVRPAFDKIVNTFNLRPLICPLQSIEEENNEKYWCYPKDRMEEIIRMYKTYRG